MFKINKYFVFILAVFFSANAIEVPLLELKEHAAALNIEGGNIPRVLLPNQLWSNLTVILDRPLITGKTLEEITKDNLYPLKESSIEEYNELKVNKAYAQVLYYYLNHAKTMIHSPSKKPIKMLIQIHRHRSATAHLNLFKKILTPMINSGELIDLSSAITIHGETMAYYYFKPQNVFIEFRKGCEINDITSYQKFDAVLAFGLAAGLKKEFPSGTLLIPTRYIPYDVEKQDVKMSEMYEVNNHLVKALPFILKQKVPQEAIIGSLNQRKNNRFNRQLMSLDFIKSDILHADKMFYPKVKAQPH